MSAPPSTAVSAGKRQRAAAAADISSKSDLEVVDADEQRMHTMITRDAQEEVNLANEAGRGIDATELYEDGEEEDEPHCAERADCIQGARERREGGRASLAALPTLPSGELAMMTRQQGCHPAALSLLEQMRGAAEHAGRSGGGYSGSAAAAAAGRASGWP